MPGTGKGSKEQKGRTRGRKGTRSSRESGSPDTGSVVNQIRKINKSFTTGSRPTNRSRSPTGHTQNLSENRNRITNDRVSDIIEKLINLRDEKREEIIQLPEEILRSYDYKINGIVTAEQFWADLDSTNRKDKTHMFEWIKSLIVNKKKFSYPWFSSIRYGKRLVRAIRILNRDDDVNARFNQGYLDNKTGEDEIDAVLTHMNEWYYLTKDKDTRNKIFKKGKNIQLAKLWLECKDQIEINKKGYQTLLKLIKQTNQNVLHLLLENKDNNFEKEWRKKLETIYLIDKEDEEESQYTGTDWTDFKISGLEDCMFIRRLFGYESSIEGKINDSKEKISKLSTFINYKRKILYMYYMSIRHGTYSSEFQQFLKEIEKEARDIDRLREDLKKYKDNFETCESSVDILNLQVERLNKTLEDKITTVATLEAINLEKDNTLNQCNEEKSEIQKKKERIRGLYTKTLLNNISMSKSIKSKDSLIKNLKEDKSRQLAQINKLKNNLSRLNSEIAGLKTNNNECHELKTTHSNLKNKVIILESKFKTCQTALESKDELLTQQVLQNTRQQSEISEKNLNTDKLEEQIRKLDEDKQQSEKNKTRIEKENSELETKLKSHKIFSKWRMFAYKKKLAESESGLPSSTIPTSPATSSNKKYSNMPFKDIYSIPDPADREKAVKARLGYWTDKFKNKEYNPPQARQITNVTIQTTSPLASQSPVDSGKSFKEINSSIPDPSERKKAVEDRLRYWADKFQNEIKLAP